ncbi:MAG TPA: D-alanine--D-alanine ligase [Ruminococcaceae bacterium]|nr:D-alanine--D-alanine ligase [Oscillospiraceae bacterium]
MKPTLAVFFGGASVEHEISVISAVQAMRSVNRAKYELIPVYITKEGDFYTGEKLLDISAYKDLPGLLSACTKIYIIREDGAVSAYPTVTGRFKKREPVAKLDFAFPVVHGTNCEDGTLQGFFELLGLPYAGCDILASAVGMDKAIFKNVMQCADIPVLPCVSFYSKKWVSQREELTRRIEEEIGFPLIVKPANLGSSVGISKVDSKEQLSQAVTLAMSFANKLLVERAVSPLREINCAVLGDTDECDASECEEPVMSGGILSYTDKYMSKGGESKGMSGLSRKLPADITAEKRAEIRDIACRAFQAAGCCGVARIDFLMDEADGGQIYVNEINTLPGSLSFYLWEAAGLKYPELIDRLVELGFKRARTKGNLMFTFDTNILKDMGALGAKGGKR